MIPVHIYVPRSAEGGQPVHYVLLDVRSPGPATTGPLVLQVDPPGAVFHLDDAPRQWPQGGTRAPALAWSWGRIWAWWCAARLTCVELQRPTQRPWVDMWLRSVAAQALQRQWRRRGARQRLRTALRRVAVCWELLCTPGRGSLFWAAAARFHTAAATQSSGGGLDVELA